ncbi:MAG: DUF433 domain-containing protein [Lentisphaerae bacterium]|nr:DUF433 domain-containing protein [Lentisphaerota bacterium]
MNYAEYIVRDPETCGGEPIIAGTRVPLRTVLASLAEGCSTNDIMADWSGCLVVATDTKLRIRRHR